MKNTTIGVDTSLQATYSDQRNPIATVVVDNVTANTGPADHSTFILDNTSLGVDRIPDTVASHLSEPGRHVVMNDAVVVAKPSVDQVVNSVVIPTLRKLLAKMLSTTDASVPNKDQNRAIKKIIREAFDDVYFEVLRGAFPDVSFGQSVGSYAIEPEPDKKSKIAL